MTYVALVPAAGGGSRMGAPLPKQYLPLLGRPVIHHALVALCAVAAVERVYVVLAPDDAHWQNIDFSPLAAKLRVLRCGGDTRAISVANGLAAIADEVAGDDWVLVHDAARACLTPSHVEALMREVGADAVGGILAVPVADTLKRESDGAIVATVPREKLWQAQTPQMFRHGLLTRALAAAPAVTDEAGAVEALGLKPRLVAADATNLKITYPLDMHLAEIILRDRKSMANAMKIGQGYDVHALVPGRKLILGGVEIAHTSGLQGHSDADVLLHAITDAILGAAGLGDIGRMFPDTDDHWKGADSRLLLRRAADAVRAAGWRVGNVDATVVAQAPKIAPFVDAMAANIAADLGIDAGAVNVKGKTTERLGFEGRQEGIAAQAVAMLWRD
jgi:2-C-methyl-D-erythritol 4-phosphate cytidylyltransferase / 2-C-methyl-D-erythritol 2,4-cyclodiphosphate synthase